jgi:hypothetical protein
MSVSIEQAPWTFAGADPSADVERAAILREHGADDETLASLLTYTANVFDGAACRAPIVVPLRDEAFVGTWSEYVGDASRDGVMERLRRSLVQLRFPVREGTSGDAAYQRAVKTGVLADADTDIEGGLSFVGPVVLALHATPAGQIPVLIAHDRADFELLIRCFTAKNEPIAVPPSMGACMIAGYNNWDRVARLRGTWVAEHGDDAAGWSEEFTRLVPQKSLYQDRFIILSGGEYSGVLASDMQLDVDSWRGMSRAIRLEHECAHYFTKRVLGSMRNALHDELIADYCGIVAAAGRFRSDWFLRFMGLEDFPRLRASGRIMNYRGKPPLSDRALAVIASLLRAAAFNVERFHDRAASIAAMPPLEARARSIVALASLGLERIGGASGADELDAAFQNADVSAPASVGGVVGSP